MNADDTLYGRIKNCVLTISGNKPASGLMAAASSFPTAPYPLRGSIAARRWPSKSVW